MLLEAIPQLRECGVDVTILATGENLGPYAGDFRRVGVRVLHLPFSKSLAFAWRFWRLLASERPAVVHIHTERANAALGLLARLAGVRNVLRTVHNVFPYEKRLRRVRTWERAGLRRLGVRHISIGPSVAENELVRLGNPTVRIDNWIGPRFRPGSPEERVAARAALNLGEDEFVVTSVGNCSVVKNHGAIIEALPSIAGIVGRPVIYLHAGSGQAEEAERALASCAAAPAEARFLGSVADVRPLLWATDVFCMPSLYEGLSIAALEAVACGVPVVLSDVPGLRDVHEPALSVRFVEPTSQGVAAGVGALVDEAPDVVRRATLRVATKVRQQHDLRLQVMELVSAYTRNRAE